MIFVNHVRYATDKDRIAMHRPAHREYLGGLHATGRLLCAGPFTDDSGALFVCEGDSP